MSKIYLQEKITGTEGQVVVINGDGEAEAQTKDFGLKPQLLITVESGAVVTVEGSGETFTQTSAGEPLRFELSGYGTYTASATQDDRESDKVTIDVDTAQIYEVALCFPFAMIVVAANSGSTVTSTITAIKNGRSKTGSATVSENGQVASLTLALPNIYGVRWDGSSTSTWSRTDDAADFTNPVPYVAGATKYSSPFDTLLPWSGMQRVTDAEAGELVAIPKYWYRWTFSGAAMKLQIADGAVDGFYVSPAHMDRGDGKGERDVVYVGRYHCRASDSKSIAGSLPKASISRATARSAIHKLGENIWQYDFAMYWTICMLYLVEFASWDSQSKIGYGCGNGNNTENLGATDDMPYHTGTMQAYRGKSGVGTQYRGIEDLWGNVMDWVDGIRFSASDGYGFLSPATYADTSGGTYIGMRMIQTGLIIAFGKSSADGFEWARLPTAVNPNANADGYYICDYSTYSAGGTVLYVGGGYTSPATSRGLFSFNGQQGASFADLAIGCRLQKLP